MGIKGILGTAIGRGQWSKESDVIGEVDQSETGNTILRVGKWLLSGSWSQRMGEGHIVLTPDEREELIRDLETHRLNHPGVRILKIGDKITDRKAEILAVQYVWAGDPKEMRGTVLAYDGHKSEYIVLTANPQGEVNHGTFTYDSQQAMNAYATRAIEHMFLFHNATPPTLTYADVADRDKLTEGK